MMSTSWRDKQRPDLVNFIATFLAINLYRLNFLSLSPLRAPIQGCHWFCRAVCVTVYTHGFDWVGLDWVPGLPLQQWGLIGCFHLRDGLAS